MLHNLVEKYWSNAWKKIFDYWFSTTGQEVYSQTPKRIVVHHSATEHCNVMSINNSHYNRANWYNTSTVDLWSWKSDVSYHYLIQWDWSLIQLRDNKEVGRGTKLNNIDSIHILFCWNFNETKPSVEQYKEWASIISKLRWLYWELPVYGHNQLEWEATACPWKNFDYRMLSFYNTNATDPVQEKDIETKNVSLAGKVEVKPKGYLWEFNITKYYSCDINQTKRLPWEVNILKKKLWRAPTNLELHNECNRRQFNWDADNVQPKHWGRFTNWDAGLAVACPKTVPWWTKLRIEWYWEVICRDVWSAITAWRLDLYVGIGDWAVDNFNNFPAGKRKVWIVQE